MDTFMDKLAQKLTAQEMIKANAAADAAELSRLRAKATEYERILEQIKEENAKNQGNAEKMGDNIHQVQANAAKVEELISQGQAKIEEIQAAKQDSAELKAIIEELKKLQGEQFDQLTEHVHKENVKVYRNVQAVVVEENAKQNELSGKDLASVSGRVGAVLGISIVALLVSAAGLVFQILVYLGIL